jgi:membrane dipeptidase
MNGGIIRHNGHNEHDGRITFLAHDHSFVAVAALRRKGAGSVFARDVAPVLRAGGVDVIGLVVGGDRPLWGAPHEEEWMAGDAPRLWGTLANLDMIWQEAEESIDALAICLSSDDVDVALAQGKIAAFLTIEGSRPICEGPHNDPLVNLRTLYRLGLRSVQLVGRYWNPLVVAADGAERSDGLSALGGEVVREMNRLGMVIDIAHIPPGDPLFWDILGMSKSPIIDSHDNAVALTSSRWNNLTDERVKAIAGAGGVMGVKYRASAIVGEGERPTIDDVVRSIDYLVDLAGVDHVGLGPDQVDSDALGTDVSQFEPIGLEDASQTQRIADALTARSYSDVDVWKVMGGNFLRLYRRVIG